jgi:hypothetical protein
VNYFAHGRRFVDAPYVLAGTAVPDWLSVINRKVRARSKHAQLLTDDSNSVVADVARGVVQHHRDDRWFHASRAFAELSLSFTVEIRDRLPPDNGFRPSFLGHILVELLLDAVLFESDIRQLNQYYEALDNLDVELIEHAVSQMTTGDVGMLTFFIPRFSAERFLYDYLDDEKLLWRLNTVMRRVRLSPLPNDLSEFFPQARDAVRLRKDELLAGESNLNQADQKD